ncbi:uncharacterized protein LOC135220885 [Macrobrachium nipponense]|uniref:uncharacterized protein LOC135220885 n=1 Tax=Macrobrachium nipponense TaxID=159736 RepID=UPI0030C7AFB8
MSFISYLLCLCLLSGTFVVESEGTSPEAKGEPNKEANSLLGGDNPGENNGTFRDRLHPGPMYQVYPGARSEPDKELNSLGEDANGTSVRDRINPGAMYPPTYQGYPNSYPSYPSQSGNGFGTYFQNGCTCPGGYTGYNPQQYNPMYPPYPYFGNNGNGYPYMPQGPDQFGYNSGTSRTEKASSPVVNP